MSYGSVSQENRARDPKYGTSSDTPLRAVLSTCASMADPILG